MITMKKAPEVTIPVTPMLDMAFQLLTFFVLTYRPAPTEGQFAMNLLPPAPSVKMDAAAPDPSIAANPDIPASLRTMTTRLFAGEGGGLSRITLEDNVMQSLPDLKQKLDELLPEGGAQDLPFDQALIRADPLLRYEELMKVIDLFSKQNVNKISFAELDVDTPGAGL